MPLVRWAAVARNIPGRTGQQCAQRWRHRVNPDIRKDKWNAAEDARLATLVRRHGCSWAAIARGLKVRPLLPGPCPSYMSA